MMGSIMPDISKFQIYLSKKSEDVTLLPLFCVLG
jgi:hypothetical protein